VSPDRDGQAIRGFVVDTIYIMTEATLVDQPEKTELEYRVIAENEAEKAKNDFTTKDTEKHEEISNKIVLFLY
jgi:hypothetical protein